MRPDKSLELNEKGKKLFNEVYEGFKSLKDEGTPLKEIFLELDRMVEKEKSEYYKGHTTSLQLRRFKRNITTLKQKLNTKN